MGASVLGMLIAAVCGPYAFFALVPDGEPGIVDLGTWIEAGKFHVDWALRYDTLSAAMVAMVSFVSMLIHVYSIGYMAHDARPRYRFFAYLSLFTFAMLMLVTADNLAQLFFGWEGVGLCSYLLIGYWYDRPAACAAAIKAFVVNRIGDLPFAVGIALIFLTFGSIEFASIFPNVTKHAADTYHLFGRDLPMLEVIGFLLFIGAMGKSAQLVPARLAARRDGGSDAGLRADPCRDHGHGRRVPDGADVAADGIRAVRADLRDVHRRVDRVLRRHGRLRAERHQAGHRLFDLFATWLHVRGGRRRRLSGLDLPPHHACFLQGAAVPQRRLGDPRDVG